MIKLKLLLGLLLIGVIIISGCIELPAPEPDCSVDTDCSYGTMCNNNECIVCPVPPCGANPGPDCHYEGGGPDERGCNYQCGTLVCDSTCKTSDDCNPGYNCVEGTCKKDGVSTEPPPTCRDNKKNGMETGVDCGGACPACDNDAPTATINAPSSGSNYDVGDTVSYSGTASDSDSPSVKISWYIDRMGDGIASALIKEVTQSPSTTSGTVKMQGTMTNTDGQTISLEDMGATYDLTLVVDDGINENVEETISFTLNNNNDEDGIRLEKTGTDYVYYTYHGKPLLSFGAGSDFIFYTTEEAFDYKRWADWAEAHDMNHIRAYLPWSWKYIEKYEIYGGADPNNALFPYEETYPGSRQFDLTKFDEAYWKRFREQMDYVESKGIIVHFLMANGWQSGSSDDSGDDENWPGHFFNPDNNINSFTDHLKDKPYLMYSSVADGKTGLVNAQKAWYRKVIQETQGYDNVYYDLIHEMHTHDESYIREAAWSKTQQWIDTMANTVRNEWSNDRPIILGMDVGGFDVGLGKSSNGNTQYAKSGTPKDGSQVDWLYTRSYFDILVFGKVHYLDIARDWRIEYNKPYITQEGWDENGQKFHYGNVPDHKRLRKYAWKFMMRKVQQMDFYYHPKDYDHQDMSSWQLYEDPNGVNPIEDQAPVLQAFFGEIEDYPNLWFKGNVKSGQGYYKLVLSSDREAVVYLASSMSQNDYSYSAKDLVLENLDLNSGTYSADIWSPVSGKIDTKTVTVSSGSATIGLPSFVDDIAVRIHK